MKGDKILEALLAPGHMREKARRRYRPTAAPMGLLGMMSNLKPWHPIGSEEEAIIRGAEVGMMLARQFDARKRRPGRLEKAGVSIDVERAEAVEEARGYA